MKMRITQEKQGTVTSPRGFSAGATEAGIKYKGRLDLGILFSEQPCASVAVFTTNRIKAAPVILSMKNIQHRDARAVVVNSGCANACTGDKGMHTAMETANLVAHKLGLTADRILVASTGVIGTEIPMHKLKTGIQKIILSPDGGHSLARAIMTTDTKPKEVALRVEDATGNYVIGGIAKGAGMIHPDMATLLCFLTTDASVEANFLQDALKRAVSDSFNMITVDGDTSTNDMVTIMANGLAANRSIGSKNGKAFQVALDQVCQYLACSIASDGEGATKMIRVDVEGAKGISDAKKIARTVAGSCLVKSAIHGNDPNWGRIVAAAGRSKASILETSLDVFLQDVAVMQNGVSLRMNRDELSQKLNSSEVRIRIRLNVGNANSTAWGCDLSEEYVTINSDYTS